jgi:Tfp pilus assembly pilus retraction ATPase PilT
VDLNQYLSKRGMQWYAMKVINLKTFHREYRALKSSPYVSIFHHILNPSAKRQASSSSSSVLDTPLAQGEAEVRALFPPHVQNLFNPSQQLAIATSVASSTPFSLIQGHIPFCSVNHLLADSIGMVVNDKQTGPPGTGKTKTIVGLVNMILLRDRARLHAAATKATESKTNRRAGWASFSRPQEKARILICAPSNAAIDEIVARLVE